MESPIFICSLGFVLEIDANYQGLGAAVSQRLGDQLLYPLSFSSHALSLSEKNYAMTDLDWGHWAVVWAIKHYSAYLYGMVFKVSPITLPF